MIKTVTVVSTYPEYGTKNIGDQLITNAVCNLINKISSETVIHVIWRADKWENVKHLIDASEHIIFACLAIRNEMHLRQYPYLQKIINSEIPFSVISAGTSLPVHHAKDLNSVLSVETIEIIRELSIRAKYFTTRGVLTQSFCETIGIKNSVMTGDVAFCSNFQGEESFPIKKQIKNIVVSDPHYAESFTDSLSTIVHGIKELFPDASLSIALHGKNPCVEKFANDKKIKLLKIYLDKNHGLDIYSMVDLHIGFRVHAHVSALKNKKYSYLIEQDGRGADYGLTLEKKISVPGYSIGHYEPSLKNLLRFILRKPLIAGNRGTIPALLLLAIVSNDKSSGFDKFNGLEKQLKQFSSGLEMIFKKLLMD